MSSEKEAFLSGEKAFMSGGQKRAAKGVETLSDQRGRVSSPGAAPERCFKRPTGAGRWAPVSRDPAGGFLRPDPLGRLRPEGRRATLPFHAGVSPRGENPAP